MENVNFENLEFEKEELGAFEFFKFDSDGVAFTGKFIGILNDTERNKEQTQYTGSDRLKNFVRPEVCGVVMEDMQKNVFVLPLYHAVENYFRARVAENTNFDNFIYRIIRIKKVEDAGKSGSGFMVFDIQKADLTKGKQTETKAETKPEAELTYSEKRKKNNS